MINPNGDDFVEDNPLAASPQPSAEESSIEPRLQPGPRLAAASGETWKQAKEKMAVARDRTEVFVRENPVPLIVGALALGLVAGWALRHATHEEKEIEVKTPLGDFNWSFLSLPFLWPFFKSVKEKYEDSTDTIKDSVRKIDIDRYAKPLRKRWKAWTH
jgi:hypothetical protein